MECFLSVQGSRKTDSSLENETDPQQESEWLQWIFESMKIAYLNSKKKLLVKKILFSGARSQYDQAKEKRNHRRSVISEFKSTDNNSKQSQNINEDEMGYSKSRRETCGEFSSEQQLTWMSECPSNEYGNVRNHLFPSSPGVWVN